jgi:hypothetical protein
MFRGRTLFDSVERTFVCCGVDRGLGLPFQWGQKDDGCSRGVRTHVRRPICSDLRTIDGGEVVGVRFGVAVGTRDA